MQCKRWKGRELWSQTCVYVVALYLLIEECWTWQLASLSLHFLPINHEERNSYFIGGLWGLKGVWKAFGFIQNRIAESCDTEPQVAPKLCLFMSWQLLVVPASPPQQYLWLWPSWWAGQIWFWGAVPQGLMSDISLRLLSGIRAIQLLRWFEKLNICLFVWGVKSFRLLETLISCHR